MVKVASYFYPIMTDRMRKAFRVENGGQKSWQTWFYWVNITALLSGALFWGYLLFDWGKELWMAAAAEKYTLLVLMFLSSLFCGAKSIRQPGDPNEEGWLGSYIMLIISCMNMLAALVLVLLFPALF